MPEEAMRDECFSHPGNDDPACAFCAAYRVGLRGSEAVSAGRAATMIALRQQWVRTTRPATSGRSDWVDLWTRDGQPFEAWWGRDTKGDPVREIEGVAGFDAGVHADDRCDAIELVRIWFSDPGPAAELFNGLPRKATADTAYELHRRFEEAEPQRLRRLARQAAELDLEVDWFYHLDDLEVTVAEWGPWRAVKAMPEAAGLWYPTLLDWLGPLGPSAARHWVAVVGVEAALEWWRLGATPAEAERALAEVMARFPDVSALDPVLSGIIDDLDAIDPALAAWAGPRVRDGVLQRAAMAQARRSAAVAGRTRWLLRRLGRRLRDPEARAARRLLRSSEEVPQAGDLDLESFD